MEPQLNFYGYKEVSSRLSNCKQHFSWAEFYVGMYVKIQHTPTVKGTSAFDIHLTVYWKRFK
jgi:hypothetical protein